jgi:hypothetical protein
VLAQSGEALSEQTGLGTSFFGAVFLAFSTSLPEISTVVAAVRMRQYAMAVSDVFGTNLRDSFGNDLPFPSTVRAPVAPRRRGRGAGERVGPMHKEAAECF